MIKTKKRPIHLDLRRIRFPINAISSLGHRISGVLMFLIIPFCIYLLDLSLSSPAGFVEVINLLDSLLVKGMLFLVIWGLMHHFLAGIRCIAIDLDHGVEKPTFLQTAYVVLLAAPPVAFIIWVVL